MPKLKGTNGLSLTGQAIRRVSGSLICLKGSVARIGVDGWGFIAAAIRAASRGTNRGLTSGRIAPERNPLRGSCIKIGPIQRSLAWPLRKDDMRKSISVLSRAHITGGDLFVFYKVLVIFDWG